jgi:hypothetical protein
MSDEAKCFTVAAICVTACLIAMVVSVQVYYLSVAREAMKGGYSQQTLPGTQGVYWVKDGEVLK